MLEFIKDVQVNEVPHDLYTLKPGRSAKVYNVRRVATGESETIFLDAVLAPKGTPEAVLDRAIKFQLLDTLTVQVHGFEFDANDSARTNLLAAVTSYAESDSIPWKLADNTVEVFEVAQLKDVLKAALEGVSKIIGVEDSDGGTS